jgi:glycerophosphoryl diester phosphodiesterase
VLVVLHDTTLDRTARGLPENCTGAVSSKTLAQIETCDVGTWFNEANPTLAKPEYVGLRIPTLEEVFRRYRHRFNYYIETKAPETADRMEERLLDLMARYRLRKPAAKRWKVLIQSFSAESLQRSTAWSSHADPLTVVLPGARGWNDLDGIAMPSAADLAGLTQRVAAYTSAASIRRSPRPSHAIARRSGHRQDVHERAGLADAVLRRRLRGARAREAARAHRPRESIGFRRWRTRLRSSPQRLALAADLWLLEGWDAAEIVPTSGWRRCRSRRPS